EVRYLETGFVRIGSARQQGANEKRQRQRQEHPRPGERPHQEDSGNLVLSRRRTASSSPSTSTPPPAESGRRYGSSLSSVPGPSVKYFSSRPRSSQASHTEPISPATSFRGE